jgi:uncharacterized protein
MINVVVLRGTHVECEFLPEMNTLVPFQAHRLLRTGHAQTLAGFLLPRGAVCETAVQRIVPLPDGDSVVLHDDCPSGWQPGDRTALLIHGLAGCHGSPYLVRIAKKLNARGVRTFRMDLRGCGAGAALARFPYHSGRSEDAAAALRFMASLCPGSPASLAGFSLGGNITLKLLGESPADVPANLDRAVAVCPPVDLQKCVDNLARGANRWYDRYFVRLLLQQVRERPKLVPDAAVREFARVPRGVGEFDDAFTAPVCGFGTAAEYYRRCSSVQFAPQIRVPTLILTSTDDPLVPIASYAGLRPSASTTLHIAPGGGHLGFIACANGDPDRRWMDWRVVEWCAGEG